MTLATDLIRKMIGVRKQRVIARDMCISEQYLSDIIHGRRLISIRAAVEFERVLGIDALSLLHMQNYELVVQARRVMEEEQNKLNYYKQLYRGA